MSSQLTSFIVIHAFFWAEKTRVSYPKSSALNLLESLWSMAPAGRENRNQLFPSIALIQLARYE